MARNNHLITRDIRVGKNAAEEDEDLLYECFVGNTALNEVLDVSTNASILSGRTGSGKSAIIQYVTRNKNAAFVSPSEMAMTHIANSDVLRFLHDIGADLNLFFQAVWKHALLVEFIRLRYKIRDEQQSRNWFLVILDRVKGDRSKARAIEYLREYAGSLWIEMDENVRQFTQTYEKRFLAELGVDISKFASKAGYGANLSNQNKSEYIARVRKIMNSEQLQDLSRVISLLAERTDNDNYYILVDHLDERWIDDSLKYRMINSLVEALTKFRTIRNLKVIVALRSDVIERSIQENADSGFQREKFRDYVVAIEWDEKKLKELIDKRIGLTFRRKYSPQRQVLFEDIFADKVRGQMPYDYILDRTLLRPRDLISFVNECFKAADNKSSISPSDVYTAEVSYSQFRYEALVDEWRVAFPSLAAALEILRAKEISFKLSGLDESEVDNIALEAVGQGKTATDPLTRSAAAHCDAYTDHSRKQFIRTVAAVLYRVGAVGLKLSPDEPVMYSHRGRAIIGVQEVGEGTGVRVVKMLHSYFRINEKPRVKARA
ncbi:MAG: DNA repair ATPase [Mesorhizobium sp.]|uniref:P-loop ATPase, Sll1717 family n=1 Tax=Mesorhizobium sp. TaxID=1871066 RepID=UPI000FEA107C|nr:hypothetical protein [Mesorhizobium sp.]RWC26984.1 MAG: DNA repair ATPase [Mesorhizobium sp.]